MRFFGVEELLVLEISKSIWNLILFKSRLGSIYIKHN
jgi:hypothetical protein